MAMLGGVEIHTVYSENPSRSVTITDHPIEQGAKISDHIQREPLTMGISGVVIGSSALRKFTAFQQKGTLLRYSYRNIFDNMVIENFDTTHDAEVKGGFKFTMTLKQIRIAKKANVVKLTKPVTNSGTKQPASKKPNPKPKKVATVKPGDSLSKIAAANGMSWQQLYAKNKSVVGKNPDLIYPGQKIVI